MSYYWVNRERPFTPYCRPSVYRILPSVYVGVPRGHTSFSGVNPGTDVDVIIATDSIYTTNLRAGIA